MLTPEIPLEKVKDRPLAGSRAEELFPAFFDNPVPPPVDSKRSQVEIVPPRPQENWLAGEDQTALRRASEEARALVVAASQELGGQLTDLLRQLGFSVVLAETKSDARARLHEERFRFVFVEDSCYDFLRDLHKLPAPTRRLLYCVLIGRHLHSCYNLEALVKSVNLVMNARDLPKLKPMLHKGLREYEELFGPFLEELGMAELAPRMPDREA